MLDPIHIEDDNFLVHAFRPEDIRRETAVSRELFAIFSDEAAMRYLPGKKLRSIEDAEAYFRGNLLSYHAGKNYLHFITEKESGRIIGVLDLITPKIAKEHYQLQHHPYFIEFYLKKEFQGCGIISRLLPEFLKHLEQKNIKEIGAVINRQNLPAKKVVAKAGFNLVAAFDPIQDFYVSTLN